LLGRALAGRDHVRLEEGSLEVDVVVSESLVDEGKHLLAHLLRSGQVVVSVAEHLGLDDGDEAVLLADRGVSGRDVGVLEHAEVRGSVRGDGEHAAPLGEAAATLNWCGGLGGESVQSLGGSLADGASERHDSEVQLDACKRSLIIGLSSGIAGLRSHLVEGLLVEDDSGDVLVEVRSGEEQLAVLLSARLV
ncbi:hypothetical protein PMAYCL1PPCAC_14392, partial [Pristionchus mayeri]